MRYALALAFYLCAMVPVSMASSVCRPMVEMISMLTGKYGERVVGMGLDIRGFMISVHVNNETSTYTILTQSPGSDACIVSAGEAWRFKEKQKLDDES